MGNYSGAVSINKKFIDMKKLLSSIALFLICFTSFGYSENYEKFFVSLLKREGKAFTYALYDRGGATKFGITQGTFTDVCNRKTIYVCDKDGDGKITSNDIRLLTPNDAKEFYYNEFWGYWKAEQINDYGVADILVDYLVNSGAGRNLSNIKRIQRILGVTPDGIIGPGTLRAINSYPPRELVSKIKQARLSHITAIIKNDPTQQKWERGWKIRINSFTLKHNETIIENLHWNFHYFCISNSFYYLPHVQSWRENRQDFTYQRHFNSSKEGFNLLRYTLS